MMFKSWLLVGYYMVLISFSSMNVFVTRTLWTGALSSWNNNYHLGSPWQRLATNNCPTISTYFALYRREHRIRFPHQRFHKACVGFPDLLNHMCSCIFVLYSPISRRALLWNKIHRSVVKGVFQRYVVWLALWEAFLTKIEKSVPNLVTL